MYKRFDITKCCDKNTISNINIRYLKTKQEYYDSFVRWESLMSEVRE